MGVEMNNLFKLKDSKTGRLYAFLDQEIANNFCDEFERPYDLIGVDIR